MKKIKELRQHLFGSPLDTAISVIILAILGIVLIPAINWALINATWTGNNRLACSESSGACWVFIKERLPQLLFGFYPPSEYFRIYTVAILGFIHLLMATITRLGHYIHFYGWLMIIFPIICWYILIGDIGSLPHVATDRWGGLFLTFVVSSVGIMTSLPLGIVLALGRRSQLPIIRSTSVVFIEIWRGVPLITVLFMSSVLLPLFFPQGITFDKLLRALIVVSLFSSAYMAEVIRGGLQAINRGQYEAARAIGLSFWQAQYHIVLPQALRHVIPGIVNTFIGLFKDTTLVSVIGMLDLLGIVQSALTDPDWLGFTLEGYVFAGLCFWIFCWSMSKYSQSLEHSAPKHVRFYQKG